MITAVSPVLRCAARALFRFRKSAAAAWRWLGANAKVLAPFGPTRLRSHSKARRRPIRTYDGTRMPAWQRERTNWCHGLPAESGHGRLSASITQGAEDGRRWPNRRFFPQVATFLSLRRSREKFDAASRGPPQLYHTFAFRPELGDTKSPSSEIKIARRWHSPSSELASPGFSFLSELGDLSGFSLF